MTERRVKRQVFKITYPTGKIYIGKDSFGSARYMGSPDRHLVNEDFTNLSEEQRRSYVVQKEILWESDSATEQELAAKEVEFIRRYRSNDPRVGLNRWPPFRPDANDGASPPATPPTPTREGGSTPP
jgi:hypothetical protein